MTISWVLPFYTVFSDFYGMEYYTAVLSLTASHTQFYPCYLKSYFIFMCLSVPKCIFVHLCSGALGGQKRAFNSLKL